MKLLTTILLLLIPSAAIAGDIPDQLCGVTLGEKITNSFTPDKTNPSQICIKQNMYFNYTESRDCQSKFFGMTVLNVSYHSVGDTGDSKGTTVDEIHFEVDETNLSAVLSKIKNTLKIRPTEEKLGKSKILRFKGNAVTMVIVDTWNKQLAPRISISLQRRNAPKCE